MIKELIEKWNCRHFAIMENYSKGNVNNEVMQLYRSRMRDVLDFIDDLQSIENDINSKLIATEKYNDNIINKAFYNEPFQKIPILVSKWDDDGIKGWKVEIPDNYANYKPAMYQHINFEDVPFHFDVDYDVRPNEYMVFPKKSDALDVARKINKEELKGAGKIWII